MQAIATRAAAGSSRWRGLEEATTSFLRAHPEYERTRALDDLREREFARLDERGWVYLDYAGSGLYAASQVRRHAELLARSVLGNPHSSNPASLASAHLVERCRHRVLDHFRADPDVYTVVFTLNASHAIRLVGESYPFGAGSVLVLTADNHNSVNGLREFARARGARVRYVPMTLSELRIRESALSRLLDRPASGRGRLLAFPAQSNFSGAQHPLEWIARARARGWEVLLDAAAFVPTNRLDLSRVQPDFVALSFYKMFGYPTGLGALLARRESLRRLERPWFAGGTVELASVRAEQFVRAAGPAAFEDGTIDFAGVPAVELGLDLVESVGIETIHARVALLARWLLEELPALAHAGGGPQVRLYGPGVGPDRGGTIAFNLLDARGRVVDPREVEARAARCGIALRTGCFCNPGAGETALGLGRGELQRCFARRGGRPTYDDLRRCLKPRAAGAVRVSLGLATTFADVWAFREFLRGLAS